MKRLLWEWRLYLGDILAERAWLLFCYAASPALFNSVMVALKSPLRIPPQGDPLAAAKLPESVISRYQNGTGSGR